MLWSCRLVVAAVAAMSIICSAAEGGGGNGPGRRGHPVHESIVPDPGCGASPKALNPTGPNVLLVGDDVSGPVAHGGYLDQLQRLLSPGRPGLLASVQHVVPDGPAAMAAGRACLPGWLGARAHTLFTPHTLRTAILPASRAA